MSKRKTIAIGRDSQSGQFTIGWQGMKKLNAVEGIRLSRASREMFADFVRKGTGAEARRRALVAKHAKKG